MILLHVAINVNRQFLHLVWIRFLQYSITATRYIAAGPSAYSTSGCLFTLVRAIATKGRRTLGMRGRGTAIKWERRLHCPRK